MVIPTGIAILSTLPGFFNLSAHGLWRVEVQAAAVRGFVLDEAALPSVPDAENVYGQPWLKRWLSEPDEAQNLRSRIRNAQKLAREESRKLPGRNSGERMDPLSPDAVISSGAELASALHRTSPDLFPPATTLAPAEEILHFTNQFGIPWQEILDAADRAESALPAADSDSSEDAGPGSISKSPGPSTMPEWSPSLSLARILEWRASALLARKENGEALRCIHLLRRLREAWMRDPSLLQFMVGTSIDTIWLNLAGDGVKRHLWNDRELSHLATLAMPPDLASLFREITAGELRVVNRQTDRLAVDPGYLDREMRRMAQIFRGIASNVRKSTNAKVTVKGLDSLQELENFRTKTWLAKLPAGVFYLCKFARTQEILQSIPDRIDLQVLRDWTLWNGGPHSEQELISRNLLFMAADHTLLQLAVALERHRMKLGQYPGTIAELVPDFLPAVPTDPCTGGEPFYLLNPDGSCEIRMDFQAIDLKHEAIPNTTWAVDPARKARMEWTLPAP